MAKLDDLISAVFSRSLTKNGLRFTERPFLLQKPFCRFRTVPFVPYRSAFALEIKGPLAVHSYNKFLMTSEGDPFFWMADTAWELFHRFDLEETAFYLDKRKSQGFNVIQAVVFSELDGINVPNANGTNLFFLWKNGNTMRPISVM